MTYQTPWPHADYENERYRYCWRCGTPYTRLELKYILGQKKPSVGEVLTGKTSGATGIVTEVEETSGIWAFDDLGGAVFGGGTATGYILMSDATGVVDDTAFNARETVNGSIRGNSIFTTGSVGIVKKYGILYAEPDLVQEDGKWYCLTHWAMIFPQKARDEAEITIEEENESDR